MLLENIQTPSNYKIYVDLDGVMSNFTKKVDKILGGGYSEDRYESDPQYRRFMWKTVGNYDGELWYELEMMPDAHTLWKYIAQYDPEVLSATGDPKYGAPDQKRRWVAEKIGPHVKVNLARRAAEKKEYACETCILIDDKRKALDPWEAAGGIGILHTSAANTISQLKKLGL